MDRGRLKFIIIIFALLNGSLAFADDQVVNLISSSCEKRTFDKVSITLDNALYYYVINQATSTCNKMSDAGVANLHSAKVHYTLTRLGSIAAVSLYVSGTCVSQKNLVDGDAFTATYVLPAGSGIVSDITAKAGLQGNNYCASAWPGSYGSFKAVASGTSANVLKQITGSVTCEICGKSAETSRSSASFNFFNLK